MTFSLKKPYQLLTYVGTIPFIACSISLFFHVQNFPILGATKQILCLYALIVAVFLAGTHWGQHINMSHKIWKLLLPWLSNLMVIMLWLSFLITGYKLKVLILLISFFLLLLIDYLLFREKIISLQYFNTRLVASIIVISSLGATCLVI
jgi:hypothetical protein